MVNIPAHPQASPLNGGQALLNPPCHGLDLYSEKYKEDGLLIFKIPLYYRCILALEGVKAFELFPFLMRRATRAAI